jgi:hypothetical protein
MRAVRKVAIPLVSLAMTASGATVRTGVGDGVDDEGAGGGGEVVAGGAWVTAERGDWIGAATGLTAQPATAASAATRLAVRFMDRLLVVCPRQATRLEAENAGTGPRCGVLARAR